MKAMLSWHVQSFDVEENFWFEMWFKVWIEAIENFLQIRTVSGIIF